MRSGQEKCLKYTALKWIPSEEGQTMGKHHKIWSWSQWYDPWWCFFGDLWGILWHEGWKCWGEEEICPLAVIWCGSLKVWTVRWAIAQRASEGDIWSGLNLLELQFLPRGMFWMCLRSKWPLFFAFCSTTSSGMIEVPCYRTRVGNHIALLGEYSIYIVGVFREGIFCEKNCQGVSYTWLLTALCLHRSRATPILTSKSGNCRLFHK